jgi:tetraacyldisaccharide 4'-kinase
MIKTPSFWNSRGVISTLLLPLSGLWSLAGTVRRFFAQQSRAELPVICIGNLTVGGTGKTPVVAYLYDWCVAAGHAPAILSRGYGGSATKPLWVDPQIHEASICGDEPLMLAEGRDVMVSRDRVAGAAAISARGLHDLILMDDGLQNPFLEKDLKIGVFDGDVGIGNGRVIPAGPLRASLGEGLAELDLALINGEDKTGLAPTILQGLPLVHATLQPDRAGIDELGDVPLLAFAGIGRPERFFVTVRQSGGNLVHWLAFADHHAYSQHDLTKLQEDAGRLGAQLITTQKDWVRLPTEWRERIRFLPVTVELDDDSRLTGAVSAAISTPPQVADNG